MTQAVAESKKIFSKELEDYFKSLELTFTLFPDNQTKSYKSLDYFYAFIQGEVDFWNKCTTGYKCQRLNVHFCSFKNVQFWPFNFIILPRS